MQTTPCQVRLCGPPILAAKPAGSRGIRHKTIAMVAFLAVEQRCIGRDTLATLLWPSSGQSSARGNLRTTLHEAAALLPAHCIIVDSDTIELDRTLVSVDLWKLREVARLASEGAADLSLLTAAATECRGGFLEGFTLRDCPDFDAWQLRTGDEVKDELALVLQSAIEVLWSSGETERALGLAARLLALDELEEGSHRVAMEAFARAGRWTAAHSQFEACKRILADELDAEPDEATIALAREIERRSARFARPARDAPRRRPAGASPPIPTTRFFGRTRERTFVHELLSEGARLVTVVGPGGIGKTRFALEVAHEEIGRFRWPAAFVDLTSITRPQEVPRAIGRALGLEPRFAGEAESVETLADQLNHRRLLLLLDNFEHVMEAAPAVARLVGTTELIRILVTSREPLQVGGEQVISLPPLDLPATDSFSTVSESAAIRMFEDRARLRFPTFSVSTSNFVSIRAICSALDGIPLALELAVPLLGIYQPDELPGMLRSSLAVLDQGGRDLPDRHRTLEQTIRWSFDLLSGSEQHLLLGLSVFEGGFDLEAARAVLEEKGHGSVVQGVRVLADKSLVQAVEEGPHRRFGLFQTTREFVRTLRTACPCSASIELRHALYFRELALRAEPELHGKEQPAWIDRLGADLPNLLAAISYLRENGREGAALEMAVALTWFWYRAGHYRLGRERIAGLLSAPGGYPDRLRARALTSLGWFTFLTGDWREAHALHLQSAQVSRRIGDAEVEASALGDLGLLERWLGHVVVGTEYAEAAVRVARQTGSPHVLTRALIWAYATTGGVFDGRPPIAELEEAKRIAESTGDAWMEAHAYNGLGDLFCELRRFEPARAAYEEALTGFTALGDRYLAAWTLEGIGRVEAGTGCRVESAATTLRALELFDALGDELNVGFMMARLAGTLRGEREADPKIAEIAGAASRMISRGSAAGLASAPQSEAAMRQIEGLDLQFPASWAYGRSISRAEAVELARARVAAARAPTA